MLDDKEFEKRVNARLNKQSGVDPTLGNFAKQAPKTVDLSEIGRKAYERVKDQSVSLRLMNEKKLK